MTTPEALIVVSSGAKQRRVWLRFEWVAQENPAQNFFFDIINSINLNNKTITLWKKEQSILSECFIFYLNS
jgi:hypothetical protein